MRILLFVGVLPVPVDKDSLAKISDTREVSSSSENKEDTENKSKNSPDCFLEIGIFLLVCCCICWLYENFKSKYYV